MPAYRFVEEIMQPWLREARHGKAMNTLRNEFYRTKPVLEFFAGCYVSGSVSGKRKIIDGAMVAQYREKRKSEGIKVTTIAQELSYAVTACNYAITEKHYNMPNPFARRCMSRLDAKSLDREPGQVWTQSQAKRLILAADPYVQKVIRFALNTGCRLREILELSYDGVYQGKRYERIVGNVLRFSPDAHKSRYWDSCALNAEALAILKSIEPVEIGGILYAFTDNGRVLKSRDFTRRFDKAKHAVGMEAVFRDTRRTCGQWMLDAGADLEGVQAQLRHRSRRTTEQHYVIPSISRAHDAVGRVSF